MAKGKKRVSRRLVIPKVPKASPTVWQALNEPVVEVSGGFAKIVFGLAVIMLVVAWVSPYWGVAHAQVPAVSYDSPLLLEKALPSQMGQMRMVAGVEISAVPDWYETAKVLPQELSLAFSQAATEVLDVSAPAAAINEFYGPGFHAVNEAWLELMADPY
jgi:hypothetical protein